MLVDVVNYILFLFQDLVNKMSQAKIVVTEELALMYAADICRIVKAMHDCNIIHGDIKPDNFLQRGLV